MRRTSARTYHEWKGRSAPKDWLRSSARSAVIWTRSWFALTNRIEECIWFPYYHHVFDHQLFREAEISQLNHRQELVLRLLARNLQKYIRKLNVSVYNALIIKSIHGLD